MIQLKLTLHNHQRVSATSSSYIFIYRFVHNAPRPRKTQHNRAVKDTVAS